MTDDLRSLTPRREGDLLLQLLAEMRTDIKQLTEQVAEIRGWGRATILIGTVLGGLAGLAVTWLNH